MTVTVPKEMNENLESICSKTGLKKAEICRRGLLDQIQQLEDAENARD